MKRVIIVCGYGCHPKPELERYMRRVVQFAQEWNPDYIIVSGGFTQKRTAPDESEANLMRAMIGQRAPGLGARCIPDEDAYTTPDNLSNAAQILHDIGVTEGGREVVIFCDTLRALKVAIYAEDHLGQVTIEAVHLDRSSAKGQIIPTLQAFVARRFPLVDRIHRSLRIRRSERL